MARSKKKPPLEVTTSKGFADWLADCGASIAFTADKAGKIFMVGQNGDGKLSLFERSFDGARGLAVADDAVLMGSGYQIWRFDNALAEGQKADGFDKLYVPQVAYTTGDVQAADIAMGENGTILFVNRLFSCLAAVSPEFSFIPVWRPPFVSELAPEDRCYLSGLAMEKALPRYLTAAGETDTAGGWREGFADGGCVVDLAAGEVISAGLSLPHAPRIHRKKLWLCDSGSGYLGTIDLKSGDFEEVLFCPGFLRGLSFHGDYAVCAVSRRFDGEELSGLPLEDNLADHKAEERCALLIIDIKRGELVHWLRLEGIIDEIFDATFIPDVDRPAALGLKGDDIRRVLSIAPEIAPAKPKKRGLRRR